MISCCACVFDLVLWNIQLIFVDIYSLRNFSCKYMCGKLLFCCFSFPMFALFLFLLRNWFCVRLCIFILFTHIHRRFSVYATTICIGICDMVGYKDFHLCMWLTCIYYIIWYSLLWWHCAAHFYYNIVSPSFLLLQNKERHPKWGDLFLLKMNMLLKAREVSKKRTSPLNKSLPVWR